MNFQGAKHLYSICSILLCILHFAFCSAPGPGSSCLWPLVPRPALYGAEGDQETGVLLSGFVNSLRKGCLHSLLCGLHLVPGAEGC